MRERFYPYSVEELRAEPNVAWRVEGVLPEGALAVIYGAAGHGKTFVTLDLSLSMATGLAWHGHDTTQGAVVYVSGEGATGIRVRVDAWERYHGSHAGPFFVVKEAVPLDDPRAVDEFIRAVGQASIVPTLIVVDTLARCFGGGDENSAQDMGKVVQALACIQRAFTCAVVVVHHSGRQGGHERGSTALRGAADTVLKVTKHVTGGVQVVCEKQKEGENAPTLQLRLAVITELGVDAKGRPRSSCVVVGRGEAGPLSSEALTPVQQQVLSAFPSGGGATATATWRAAAADVPERTFYSVCGSLLRQGFVESPKRGTYVLIPQGTSTRPPLQATTPTATAHGCSSAATAPPRKGGQCSSSPQQRQEQT